MNARSSIVRDNQGLESKRIGRAESSTKVYALIHESLARGFILLRDSTEGYLYRGTLMGSIPYQDGRETNHYLLLLARPALYLDANNRRTEVIALVVSPRYAGDDLRNLPRVRVVTVNFSFSPKLNRIIARTRSDGIMMEEIEKEMIDVGIGEIQIDPPRKAFVEAPWDMTVYGSEKR